MECSTEALKMSPEFGPALQQVVAQINVLVVATFFIDHTVGIRVVRYKLAAFEVFFEEVVVETNGNQRLRLVLRIASVPARVRSADCGRKAVLWSQEIDRTSLAVVSGYDSGSGALVHGD